MFKQTIWLDYEKVPTITAQQKGVRVVHGKPMFYEKPEVRAVRKELFDRLRDYAPPEPVDGAVKLSVAWNFATKDKKKLGRYRTTRPDTDNLQKLLKDVMTDCGFWNDDSQVCYEVARKKWAAVGFSGICIDIEEVENE